MRTADLIRQLNQQGIFPYVEAGKLKTRSGNADITPELVQLIRAHKDALIAFLLEDSDTVSVPVTPIPRRADPSIPAPLSFSQRRLWFIDQLEGGSAEYNMPAAFGLSGVLDLGVLQRSLDTIVERHAVLRTVFRLHEGEPVQVVLPLEPVAIHHSDFEALDSQAQQAVVQRMIREEARRPFDLANDRMLRCSLLRLRADYHVVLFTMHHIASDGWSMGVLIREFVALYEAGIAGREAQLPELRVQYGDFAAWQRESMQGDLLAAELAYWQQRLAGMPVLHSLPLDKPRPAQQSFGAERIHQLIDKPLLDATHRLARRQQATLFMALQSAFAVLLSRFSGESDIVMGVPNGGRAQQELAPLIGFFINSQVLRTQIDPQQTVAELLTQARHHALDAFARNNIPFDLLVDTLKHPRSLAYNPLCQVKFVVQNHEVGELELPGLKLEPVGKGEDRVHFDLDLTITETAEGLQLSWSYKAELFQRASIERMAEAYRCLLQAMVAQPDARLIELSVLEERDLAALRAQGEGPVNAIGREQLLPQRIEAQASRTPEAVAVRCGEQWLSYAALNAKANRLAHLLMEQGVGRGSRVGVHLGRSVELLLAQLAVMKTGAAYVLLDPKQNSERLGLMARDAGLEVVLLDSRHTTLPVLGLDMVYLDEAVGAAEWLSEYSEHAPDVKLSAEDSVYVLYTSGSTGEPKGVEVHHGGVIDYCAFAQSGYYGESLSGSLVATSAAFDLTLPALYVPLLAGGCVTLLPEGDELEALTAWLAQGHEAVLLRLTPSHVQALLLLSDEWPRPAAHVFVIGGEVFEPALARRLQAKFPASQIYNHYGPTETVVGCAWYDVSGNLETLGERIALGRAMENTTLYVLDESGRLQATGVAGELYIGGAGVAKGYVNRPEQTAAQFVANPFGAGRLYRSGDRVRWRADGNLEFLGRIDRQVKLRGFRIELGEIESRLRQCAGVREAVVRLWGEAESAQLVAYLVAAEGLADIHAESPEEVRLTSIRSQLTSQLPDYMQPSGYVWLDRLPLTVNGKVDVQALPAPDGATLLQREYEAPQGEIEQALAGLWQTLLGREQVGRHDHFFELGGHSLLAVQLMSHIRATLNVEVPLRALFAQPTLQALAETVAAAGASTLGRIEMADRSQPLPLSLAQQRLWFLDQLDPAASASYHLPTALRLSGTLNRQALHATLDRLVARHEGLRTRFVAVDGVPYQVIASQDIGFALVEHDLGGLDADTRAQRVAQWVAEEARAPFDLAKGPLIRGQLLHLSDEEHVLLITQHHIITDGWSIGVMVREVAALYTAFCQDQPDPLPALDIQYADYAAWQRGWLQGEELERQIGFWREHLRDAPALLELPTDRPRPPAQSYMGGRVRFDLSPRLTAGLRTLTQRHGTTLFMTLLAGWSVLLSRLSGQSDVVIGTPVANRQRREVEELIGFFVNTLALRVRLDDNTSVAQLLQQVKETTLSAFGHQELPFEQVVEAVQPVRSLSHSPLAQASFTWHNQPDGGELVVPGLTLVSVASTHNATQIDLSLHLVDVGEVFSGALVYASDLFDASTIERWAGHFMTLLEAMVADDARRIVTLPLLSGHERDQLLRDFNATAAAYPDAALVHELFEARVAVQPDAVAVVYEDERLTYGELNARANQLAHYLMEQGIQPDDRVAICVERSLDMVVGLLGILKSGAGYVPLDPAYPAERLAYLLADSAPKLLLTQTGIEEQLPASDVPVLRLDVDLTVLARRLPNHDPQARQRGLTPRHLAYVIYTSGSTGMPKGVMVEHRSVCNLAIAHCDLLQVGAGSRVLQFASMAFDVCVAEVFMALLGGACLCMAPQHKLLPGRLLQTTLRELDVTHALFAASVASACEADDLSSLKCLMVGGDVCSPDLARRLRQRTRLFNVYGPTEAAVAATAHDCVSDHATTVPIGRPLANIQIYILDAHGEPVPVGVTGEIHLGGVGVARGYLNRPELTAERFVADAFNAEPDARMYKTGDLGRWLPDGNVAYVSRNDFQVKIRGFRIELGEIEAKLAACEGVREAVVEAREDVPGDKRLVAYLVADDGVELSAAQLRRELAAVLPEYMIPAAFVMLAALPLTPNGKLDRRLLPAPDGAVLIRQEYEEPRGDVERALAQVWLELLGVPRVGRHDNFFELGGHSLKVVGMVDRLRQQGHELAVRDVFTEPTVAALAVRMAQATKETQTKRVVPANGIPLNCQRITPGMLPLAELGQAEIDSIVSRVPGGVANVQDIYRLSPLQEGMLFHHLVQEHGDAYVSRIVLQFDSRNRLDAFMAALQKVIGRHDILRTAMRWEELEQAVQLVLRDVQLPVRELAIAQPVLPHLLETTKPYLHRLDLQRAPLMSAFIADDRESDVCYLALLFHHLICDHLTMELLVAEVNAFLSGQESALPPPLPYRNFIAHSRQLSLQQDEDYFRREFGDVDQPAIPYGVVDVQGSGVGVVETKLLFANELAERIREAARRERVTPAVLFHAAWAQVLGRLSGCDDVVFGSVLSGRQGIEGAEQAIGMFINTLPLRLRLRGLSVQEVIGETHARLTELLEHEQSSLALAQRASGVKPPMPLFTALMNYRHTVASSARETESGLSGMMLVDAEARNNYPLTMSVSDLEKGFALTALAAPGVDGAATCRYLHDVMAALVEALEREPASTFTQLSLFSTEEEAALRAQGEGPVNAAGRESLLPQRIEAQAARTPEAVAVRCGEQWLSYAALNAKANRLAHLLMEQGVGRGARVGVHLGRSVELLLAQLAVMKTGAAYVLLDPKQNSERLGLMARDAGLEVVLLDSRHTTLPVLGLDMVYLDDAVASTDWLSEYPEHTPELELSAEDSVYVLYTSGSTGEPKGVEVHHGGVIDYCAFAQRGYYGESLSGSLVATSAAFDLTLPALYVPLLAGGCVTLLPEQDDLEALTAWLAQRHEAVLLRLTPSHVQALLLLSDEWPRPAGHVFVIGGEVFEPALARRLQAKFPASQIYNHYGPTETVVGCAWYDVSGNLETLGERIALGRAMENTTLYVLDESGRLQAPGVAGELYIGSAGVAKGYVNRPEQTAAQFVANPFGAGRLYRSGDRVRWRADGNLEFLGRIDRQVKLRGFRIELGEIESRLRQCAGVREAVVRLWGEAESAQLVAYLVAAEADTPAQSPEDALLSIQATVAAQLPSYMQPSGYVWLDRLPLTVNGKVDVQALPAPEGTALARRAYEAPRGDVEQTLAGLWQTLLGVERVGRHDHFFELGGHSLLLMQLVVRIRETFNVDIPLRRMFEAPSLAAFADLLIQAQLQQFSESDIASLEEELANLSESELQALLSKETE